MPDFVAIRSNRANTTTREVLRSPHAIVAKMKTIVSSFPESMKRKQFY